MPLLLLAELDNAMVPGPANVSGAVPVMTLPMLTVEADCGSVVTMASETMEMVGIVMESTAELAPETAKAFKVSELPSTPANEIPSPTNNNALSDLLPAASEVVDTVILTVAPVGAELMSVTCV